MAEIRSPRRGNESRGAPFHHRAQRLELVRMFGEFGSIAAAKFGKARRLMAIPFA
jgi:hypothetical protein